MTGPTVEGSIVAKVKADISNLEENIATAEATVEKLTGKKPEIKVKANVAEALTKLEAVEAATDRAAAANTRLAIATKALQEVSASETATAKTIIPVRKEAIAALQEATTAAGNLKVAQRELAAEEEKAAAAAKKAAAAGSGGQFGFFQMALVAVAALIPLLGPLAGYLSAVTGAFAGMGAAGVLAVFGIKNAMAQGTAAGDQFAGGLHLLKGSLDSLSATAANAMLDNFQRAVSTIDANLPSLNSEIRIFSTLLGNTGNIVLATLISGFKTLLPLFSQAGVYIEQVAVGFQKWTTNGGLATWSRDASVALPQVANALGSLLHGVISVVGALQPLGSVMLGAISLLGNLLTVLSNLGPALPIVTAGVLAAVGAFKLAPVALGLVSKAITALGISTEIAVGPIGWIAAAISAVAAVALTASAATNNAAAAVDSYAAAIQQDNGVIGKNTAAQAANNLERDGAYDAARKLGISVKTLTDATLGNTSAQETLKTKLEEAKAKYTETQVAMAKVAEARSGEKHAAAEQADVIQQLTTQYNANRVSVREAWKSYNDIAAAQGLTTYTTKAQQAAVTALAASYGESVGMYLNAKAAQKSTADQLAQTTANMVQQNDAGGLLTQTLDKLNGKTLTAAQAQNQFDSQIANMGAHIDKTGNSVNRANDLMTGMTAAAVANRGELISLVQAAEASAEAFRNNGGSAADTTTKLETMKKEIIDNAVAHGENRDQVQSYVDTLFKIPSSIPATHIELDAAVAQKQLQDYINMLASIPGYSAAARAAGVNISTTGNVTYSDAKNSAVGRATGGITGSGELTLVGEKGPEWARFPAGTQIYPNGVKPLMSNRVTNTQTTNNSAGGLTINAPMTTVVQSDPQQAMQDQFRRLNMLAS